MKFFIDTADKNRIMELIPTGMIDGVTTNPSLIAKNGDDMATTIKGICNIQNGPVSAEVTAIDHTHMVEEGQYLASLAENVVVKVPLTVDGLIACKTLRHLDIDVNVTLCFSVGQALLAAKADATYISPFVGRLDDTGESGMDLIKNIVRMYGLYRFDTQVLVASIRNIQHVEQAAVLGADVCTIPPKVLLDLYEHHLTKKGLDTFLADWANTGQSILPEGYTNLEKSKLVLQPDDGTFAI
jgi:transaldolase